VIGSKSPCAVSSFRTSDGEVILALILALGSNEIANSR
jgi:hypothetical protein